MNRIRIGTSLLILSALLVGSTGRFATHARQAQATGFASPEFERLWARTDQLVASGQVKRSYHWGPQPISGPIWEEYAKGPGGKHLVQYFDKSRMEINNPNGDRNNPFFVTNGLLAIELITGKIQEGGYPYAQRWPAYIPLGDNTDKEDEITYASFRSALESKGAVGAGIVGRPVQKEIRSDGPLDLISPGTAPTIGAKYNLKYAYFESATLRGIPDVFWSFLNTTGPVVQDGQQLTARLSEPYFYATGYPTSDAYWAQLTVGGKRVDALIQAYERRMLTYVPSAPEGFKVQMGNVGQHYYDWRYKDAGKPPSLAGRCSENPVLGFGKLYTGSDRVKIELGCERSKEERETVVRQTFQRGQIIGVARIESYTNRRREDIYVLFDGESVAGDSVARTFQVYTGYLTNPNAPPTPVPAPPSPDPDDLYTPTGTFAEVWNANPDVRQLGKATAPPDVRTKDQNGVGGGVVQYFKGGLMVYPNLSVKKIYVLYSSTGYAYIVTDPVGRVTPKTNVDRWAAYDDTYVP